MEEVRGKDRRLGGEQEEEVCGESAGVKFNGCVQNQS